MIPGLYFGVRVSLVSKVLRVFPIGALGPFGQVKLQLSFVNSGLHETVNYFMSSSLIEQIVASLYCHVCLSGFADPLSSIHWCWLKYSDWQTSIMKQEHSCIHRRHCCFSTWLCSVVSTITKFHLDYRPLLELHALPLAAYSYVLLPITIHGLYVSRPLPCIILALYTGSDEGMRKVPGLHCLCMCLLAYIRICTQTVYTRHPFSSSSLCLGTRLVWCVRWGKA